MEEKKSFGTRLEAFFAGKGFYIVLLLCVSVIGISVWSMLSGVRRENDGLSMAVSGMDGGPVLSDAAPVTVTEAPAPRPVPTASPAPSAAPQESEAPAAAEPEEQSPQVPAAAEPADYYIWPVSGSVEAEYAMEKLRYDPTMRDWRSHDGLDIAAEQGTQVRAAANGSVSAVYEDERYGATVVLRHGGGVESVYANLAATPTVQLGETVGVGQVIGAVGDTALCEIGEAAHLHFAMRRDGASVDPAEYLPARAENAE